MAQLAEARLIEVDDENERLRAALTERNSTVERLKVDFEYNLSLIHDRDSEGETMAILADDAALQAAAGDCQLQVEVRAGAADAFGKGNRRRMRFGALLRKVAQGATQYYLTTQELPQLRGGGEQLVGPPLSRLPGRFPLRPPLLPSLIPQSINLWLGRADGAGASSGLHHDFHDNLYCLLRGRKWLALQMPLRQRLAQNLRVQRGQLLLHAGRRMRHGHLRHDHAAVLGMQRRRNMLP